MNPLDMVIVVILAFCLIRGIFRGLIKEVSSIVGVFAGFYSAYTYYPLVAKPISRWISDTPFLNILSFLVVFCAVFLIISIIGVIIKYLLNIAFLGWVDRICGAGFGITKGILIVSVILIPLTSFLPKGSHVIKNSLLSPYVTMVSEKMVKVVSPDMKKQYDIKIKDLKKAWKI